MRFPLTRYGLPQVIIFPLLVIAAMALLFVVSGTNLILLPLEVFLFIVLIWMLSFFRDPLRVIVPDETVLYSPADGTITDISRLDDTALGVPALRIGMFLSIYNVHINRVPCSVRIDKITYNKGRFRNAKSPDSSRVNESNDILMTRLNAPGDVLLVRQVSGAVARHIVCRAREKAEFAQGEPFGMIKFGSRTELYLPSGDDDKFEVTVKIGDRVRAGLSPLVRYRP